MAIFHCVGFGSNLSQKKWQILGAINNSGTLRHLFNEHIDNTQHTFGFSEIRILNFDYGLKMRSNKSIDFQNLIKTHCFNPHFEKQNQTVKEL